MAGNNTLSFSCVCLGAMAPRQTLKRQGALAVHGECRHRDAGGGLFLFHGGSYERPCTEASPNNGENDIVAAIR